MESNHYASLYEGDALPLCYLGAVVPRQGFEPQLPEPKSDVLPITLSGSGTLSSFVVPPGIEPRNCGLQPHALPIKLKNQYLVIKKSPQKEPLRGR
jgi:hypothetical protein